MDLVLISQDSEGKGNNCRQSHSFTVSPEFSIVLVLDDLLLLSLPEMPQLQPPLLFEVEQEDGHLYYRIIHKKL